MKDLGGTAGNGQFSLRGISGGKSPSRMHTVGSDQGSGRRSQVRSQRITSPESGTSVSSVKAPVPSVDVFEEVEPDGPHGLEGTKASRESAVLELHRHSVGN
jgi:hypothetical protein